MGSAPKRERSPPKGWGARHNVAVMLFFASTVSYSMRMNLSLAIVAMVNRGGPSSASSNVTSPASMGACSELTMTHHEEIGKGLLQPEEINLKGITISPTNLTALEEVRAESGGGEFNWNEAEQGLILGTFFWGYVITQIPGGILAKRFGGKWPLGIGMLTSAVFSALTPLAARTHVWLLVLVRVMQGLGSGMHIGCQANLIAAWAPPNERSTFGAVIYGGVYFGTAVTLVTSGYLIHENVLGGWPSVFYLAASMTVVWFGFWCFLVYSSPSEHPRISPEECMYILEARGPQNNNKKLPTPWKAALTSLPLWANFIAHIAQGWGLFTLLTELPTYMKTVLNFSIRKNSILTAIPYVTSWLVSLAFGYVADKILRRKLVSTGAVRKFSQLLAQGGSALALIAVSYTGCNSIATVSLLIIAVGLCGVANSGFVTNYVELAPNHVGIIMAACNTIANFSGFGAPYVAGLILNENPSIENWRTVFLLSAGVFIVSTVFYLLFASGEEQPWNSAKVPEKGTKTTTISDEEDGDCELEEMYPKK